jgi:hypothetical protein
MTFVPIGHSQTQAYKVAVRLRQKYSEWAVDRKPNETPIPYLRWTDDGARDAYWLICTNNKIPREA